MIYEEAQELVARLREGCEVGKNVPVVYETNNGNCCGIKVGGRKVSALTLSWKSEAEKLEAYRLAVESAATTGKKRLRITAG